MRKSTLGLRVGILGGGQLARMLAHSAQRMGMEAHVLCPGSDEPAAQVTGFHHAGGPAIPRALQEFLKSVDVLTFESEFFDMQQLENELGRIPQAPRVFPAPGLMRELQDRRTQKSLLVSHKVPTADFMAVATAADLATAWRKFSQGFVLKKARGGYDGFGTFYVRKEADIAALQEKFPGPCIAEAFVKFKRELSLIAVCGEKERIFLPLVETHQKDSRCDWVLGPAKATALKPLQTKLSAFLKKTGYRGVIAFELFETAQGLLVNEIAPRVHNSGHVTMQALSRSQFDLHWEAGLGLRLDEPTALAKAFVMTNLIGESNDEFVLPPKLEGTLHWYGKKQNRAGRKMGHINYLGSKGDALLRKALAERKRIRK